MVQYTNKGRLIVKNIIYEVIVLKDCCKVWKIAMSIVLLCTLLAGVIYFVFMNCNQIGCKRIKNKANKVFNEMGELIGEFTYFVKK